MEVDVGDIAVGFDKSVNPEIVVPRMSLSKPAVADRFHGHNQLTL
jgi:ferredoxin-fold anticodon binding domain-containing protein